jgi:hypothetical protein
MADSKDILTIDLTNADNNQFKERLILEKQYDSLAALLPGSWLSVVLQPNVDYAIYVAFRDRDSADDDQSGVHVDDSVSSSTGKDVPDAQRSQGAL